MKIKPYEFQDAVERVGEFKLRNAFKKSKFIYGTQGNGSTIVKGLHNWGKCSGLRKLNLFETGRRGGAYLSEGCQMMDLYYGQAGTTLHLKRDPVIAEFVHYAMDFKSAFTMRRSGRDEYIHTFKTSIEGWDNKSPSTVKYNGLTATKEMSRIIRWGIARFGGTLIFEGKDIYYSQVFDPSAPRVGDTDLEARELFKYFKPNCSSVPFGKGKLIFYWNGQETIPTKSHFISNWQWSNNQTHTDGNFAKSLNENTLFPTWRNFALAPLGKQPFASP